MKNADENIPSLANAKIAESEGRLEDAVKIYSNLIKSEPLHELVFDRLMIIYRKLKDYKRELQIITSGIKAYETFYRSKITHKKSSAIAKLSDALLLKTGLTDKKGNHLYEPEPIARWRKRLRIVESKLKPKQKKIKK